MRTFKAALSALALALMVGVLAILTTAPAQAAVIDKGSCRKYDPNLKSGQCYRFPDGRIAWLGNFTNPAGKVFFCIDKNKDSRLPVNAARKSTAGLKNQFGKAIGKPEIAALNYVVDKWGRGSTEVEAAAIALIIRQVMSDTGGQFPSGLTVTKTVGNLAGGLPSNVLSRARTMWSEASDWRGPWTVELNGSTADMTIGKTRVLRANVRSGADKRVPGVKISVGYNARVSGPATVTSKATGPAEFTITARAAGTLAITAEVEGPAGNGVLFIPANNKIQRGWISDRSTDKAKLQLAGEITATAPSVTTTTSSKLVEPGVPFFDNVRVINWPDGVTATATAQLYGEFATQPGAASCVPGKLVRTVTFPINRSGTYQTPPVNTAANPLTGLGRYTWVISLPATAGSTAVRTACGIVQETTLVARDMIEVAVETQISSQTAEVGDTINDAIKIIRMDERPFADVPSVWTLRGPAEPVNGVCATEPPAESVIGWDDVPVAATGDFTISTEGALEFVTPDFEVRERGCYSFGVEVLGTDEVAPFSHPFGLVSETTLVDRVQPTIRTQVSAQKAGIGAELVDTIVVGDLPAWATADVIWTHYGPVAPINGSCVGVDYTGARVHDQDTISVTGSRSVVTRKSAPIKAEGCYTFGEEMAETDATKAVTHLPGQVTQTTLVSKWEPQVRTQVSRQKVKVGGRLRDKIMVTGLPAGQSVQVDWILYGAKKPVNGSCKQVKFTKKSKVFDSGSLTVAANGSYLTRKSKVIRKAGCYTYAEWLAGTDKTTSVWHEPGKRTQTSLAVKPPKKPKPPRPGIPGGPDGWARA